MLFATGTRRVARALLRLFGSTAPWEPLGGGLGKATPQRKKATIGLRLRSEADSERKRTASARRAVDRKKANLRARALLFASALSGHSMSTIIASSGERSQHVGMANRRGLLGVCLLPRGFGAAREGSCYRAERACGALIHKPARKSNEYTCKHRQPRCPFHGVPLSPYTRHRSWVSPCRSDLPPRQT